MRKRITHGNAVVTFNSGSQGRLWKAIRIIDQLSTAIGSATDADDPGQVAQAAQQMVFGALVAGIESASGLPFTVPTGKDTPAQIAAVWRHYLDDDSGLWDALEAAAREAGCMQIWGG